MIFFIIAALLFVVYTSIEFFKYLQAEKNVRKAEENVRKAEKNVRKTKSMLKSKAKLGIVEHEKKIKELSEKLGECSIDIPIAEYWDKAVMYIHYISVFEISNTVIINGGEYRFSDILGFSLVDDATNETITTSIGEAKTSTGSILGRAVVGNMLTGGLGAVVGAVTAKKNIETNAASQTTTTHKYTMYINVNSLASPTITIPIGQDEQTAHHLANLFNVIIAKGQG